MRGKEIPGRECLKVEKAAKKKSNIGPVGPWFMSQFGKGQFLGLGNFFQMPKSVWL